jgi:chromosomal replication initiation ATPase DnaA
MQKIKGIVFGRFDINTEIIKGSSKQRDGCRARSIVCYLAVESFSL